MCPPQEDVLVSPAEGAKGAQRGEPRVGHRGLSAAILSAR